MPKVELWRSHNLQLGSVFRVKAEVLSQAFPANDERGLGLPVPARRAQEVLVPRVCGDTLRRILALSQSKQISMCSAAHAEL